MLVSACTSASPPPAPLWNPDTQPGQTDSDAGSAGGGRQLPTDSGAGGQGAGNHLADFVLNPANYVAGNCDALDPEHLTIAGKFGGDQPGILVNIDVSTLEVITACGALTVAGDEQPTPEGTPPRFWLLPDRRVVVDRRELVPDLLGACRGGARASGDQCKSYAPGWHDNDVPLTFTDAAGMVREAIGARAQPGSGKLVYEVDFQQWESEDGTVFSEAGVFDVAEQQLAAVVPNLSSAVLQEYGADGTALIWAPVRRSSGGLTAAGFLLSTGDDDVQLVNVTPDSHLFVSSRAHADGFWVVIESEDGAYRVNITLDGTWVEEGDFPHGPGTDHDSQGQGGTLHSDGCLYTQVRGPGKIGALVRRCVGEEQELLVSHEPCDPFVNFCIRSP